MPPFNERDMPNTSISSCREGMDMIFADVLGWAQFRIDDLHRPVVLSSVKEPRSLWRKLSSSDIKWYIVAVAWPRNVGRQEIVEEFSDRRPLDFALDVVRAITAVLDVAQRYESAAA
jgi:hypothetical protein